ncbi:proprotein convertase subtilisin/kexin type 5-like isoform X2 [Ruditapes philippinarum]|nr:proprotein convertase subtilisin/kexin type 5-like isoform X2 [Ruditapes philippinarum]
MFVDDNRNCISACPEQTFYKETLKQTISKSYLERKCVKCDMHGMFISNASCVNTCPSKSRYIDENTCISQCPEARSLKINKTIHNLLHYQCIIKCPAMEEDGFCTSVCSKNKVVSGSSCREQCPLQMPYLLNNSCHAQCPNYAPADGVQNKCVQSKCPDERPFVVNNTCVDSCPNEFTLINSTLKDNIGFKYCLKDCEDKYKYNNNCVSACPSETVAVENTCVDSCPMYTSYKCIAAVGYKCGENIARRLTHAICVYECPQYMFIWNNMCVFSCNSGLSIFGKECTETCPVDKPYKQNITHTVNCYRGRCESIKTDLNCVQKCSSESYISNYSCFQYCPSNFLYVGNNCVSQCPKTEPLIENSTITVKTWSYQSTDYYYDHRHYTQSSEEKHIQKCVAVCSTGMILLNSTCVKTCPIGYTITANRTCSQSECITKYKEVTKAGTICLDQCRSNTFRFNNTCVETCSGTYMKYHFNGTCTERCPDGYNNIAVSVTNEVHNERYWDDYWEGDIILNRCTKDCGDEYFQYNGSCVNFCQPPLLTFNRTCVTVCPLNSHFYSTTSLSFNRISLENSGKRFQKENITETILNCEINCPNNTVLLDSKCVNMCPLNRRYIINGSCQSAECKTKYRYYHSSGVKCFDKCPTGLFVSNTTCVLQCLDNQYQFNQTCVHSCPSTHLINERYITSDLFSCWYSYSKCTKRVVKVKECRENCPPEKFLYNGVCLNICPKHTLTLANRCVNNCSITHQKIEEKIISIYKWVLYSNDNAWEQKVENHETRECVSHCSERHHLQYRNSCLTSCPDDLPFQVNNVCVEKCPENKLTTLTTKVCVDKCASDYGEFNRSCHSNCPQHIKYIFNARCVSECPSSHPVALENDRFVCRKSCGGSKLFRDGECIESYSCDDPMFEYDGWCLRKCPDGFVWFISCQNTLVAKIAIGILTMLLVVLFHLSRHFLLDFITAARLIFKSKEMIVKMEKQLIPSGSNFKLNDIKKATDDEISLLLPHMEDEHYL